jgi:hypothetical protein
LHLKILNWVQNERVGASLSLEPIPPSVFMCCFAIADEMERCSCISFVGCRDFLGAFSYY